MDNETLEVLSKKIINIYVKKYLEKSKPLGLEPSDLYQEGLYGFLIAIDSYDINKNVKFETYASKIVERKIKDYIRINNKFRNSILNEAISYDDNLNLTEIYSVSSVEDQLLANELDKEITKMLTIKEYKVYELKKDGKENKIISLILNIPIKNIENALQRIRVKVRRLI